MKNKKRERKHPLADKVDKAFKGKLNSAPRKKDLSDDKLGISKRKVNSASGKKSDTAGSKYSGLGNKYKGAEKAGTGNSKTKPGPNSRTRSSKGDQSTGPGKYDRKAPGNSKRPRIGDGKSSIKNNPLKSDRKDSYSFKGADHRKTKPERGDRKTSKADEVWSNKKRIPGANIESSKSPKGKSQFQNKTSERYKRRKPTDSSLLEVGSPENQDGLIRLNRYIANSGICSRRDADELIQQGLVEVNGVVITEMGYKVKPGDTVRYDGAQLKREKLVYILLNKPKDFITTMDDPLERKTVMQLVAGACKERVFPVGRLDRNTTGLLLLTNDGALTEKLTHPSHQITKVYQVEIDKPISMEDIEKIASGNIYLEDGQVKVDDIAMIEGNKKILGIQIHEGRNRIVRRIFEHLGYEVVKLDRTMYANLTKKDLSRGEWRFLTEKELINLKHKI